MASPFGKSSSPFADMCGGTSNGFRRFEDEMKNPVQQSASQMSFAFGKASPFLVTEPKNSFEQSTLFGGGGSSCGTSQTTIGSSVLGHASDSSLSFGKGSPFSVTSKNEQKDPFQQPTLLGREGLASGSSQTRTGNSIPAGHSTPPPFSFGNASPFAISSNDHKPELKNPFQKSILPGSGSSTSSLSQIEAGSSIPGRASTPFGVPFGQAAFSTPHQNPLSPFAPASPKAPSQHPFWRSFNSNSNSGFGIQRNSMGNGGFVWAPTSQGISLSDNRGSSPFRQNSASTSPFLVFGTPGVMGSVSMEDGKNVTGMLRLLQTDGLLFLQHEAPLYLLGNRELHNTTLYRYTRSFGHFPMWERCLFPYSAQHHELLQMRLLIPS